MGFELPPSLRERLQTPALLVSLPAVRRNVAHILSQLEGRAERWRPHVKTTKIPAVWSELLRAGIRHFKCATTREAAHLLALLDREGVEGDLLVAYPLLGPNLRRLGELAAAHPRQRVAVLSEDKGAVQETPASLSIFLDLNPGMNRTGIPASNSDQWRSVANAAGSRLRGLHWYDGHLHEANQTRRRERAFAGYARLLEIRTALVEAGLPVEELITSGTPIFRHSAAFEGFRELEGTVHRMSPGTVVFHDARTAEEAPELELEPAAVVLTRVVSHPAPNIVTCDAGSKAVAAEAGDPCALVLGRPELLARTPNEEHLPFEVRDGNAPARGETLLLFPRHICPTVNLAEEAVLLDDGSATTVAVAARAHELLVSD